MAGPSFWEETRSTEESCMEVVDEEGLEREFESLTDDKEAVELPLTDTVFSAEIKEDNEEEPEAGFGCEEVKEEEGGTWGDATLSVGCFWSFPFEQLWNGEQEAAVGGDAGVPVDAPGSAGGEDGGELWDKAFFSEEWEDRDSWLPIGVVLGLLLNVSPEGRKSKKHHKVVIIWTNNNPVFDGKL